MGTSTLKRILALAVVSLCVGLAGVAALLGIRSSALFAVSATRRHSFLDGCHVESSNRDASIIIEPYDNTGASGVKTSVIGAGNGISSAAASNDRERFKRNCL